MTRTGLELDPRSRPGTILPGYNTNPLEVAQGRMKVEQVAGLQADKIAADKEKADKAAATAAVPEFGTAYAPHTNEFLQKTGAFTNGFGARLQKYNQTKDPNDDPSNPSSQAFMDTQAEKWALNQELKISQQDQADWTAFEKEYNANPGKYTPEEFQLKRAYHDASPALKISGEIKPPEIEGYWNKEKWIADTFAPLEATGWENSVYDPELDIFTDTGGGGITEDRIKKQAYGTSAPGTQPNMRLTREIAQLPATEQKRISDAAAKEGVTPAQYKAFEDMKGLAYKTYTESQKKAGLKEGKWGAGWGNDRNSAERLVSLLQGTSTGDQAIFTGLNPNFVEDLKESGDISSAMTLTLSDELRGMPLSTASTDTGAKIPVTIDRVEAKNGIIKVYRKRADGVDIEALEMPQKDFASNITEEIIEGSPELKRGMLYEVMKERGMIDAKSGYIKAGSPSVSSNPYNQAPATTKKKF